MTELEALRRVAEAARKWARWMDHRMADASFDFYCEVSFALEVLDALPEAAEPATPARSRLAALEALHAVVRDYDRGTGQDVRWSDIMATLDELDALPAPATEPEGEAFTVEIWVSDADEAAYDRMEERLADIIGGYLRRAGVAFREHDDLACANHLLAEATKEPLASRLALARALVPGWAVVPVEPTVAMLQDGDMAIRHARPGGVSGMTIEAQTKAECARAGACWAAMLTAAEEPPHGP